MRRKKLFSLALVATLTATMFAGCGGTGNSETKDDGDKAAKDGKTVLELGI